MIVTQPGIGGASGQQIATTVASVGTPLSLVAIMGASAAGGPIGLAIGAAIVGVTALISSLFGQGNKRATAATQRIESALTLFKQNTNAFLAGPHTAINQAAALKNFDDIWSWVTSPAGCADQSLERAGEDCLKDFGRGGKFDIFPWHRDQIANTPLIDAPGTASGVVGSVESVFSSLTGGATGGGTGWLLLAGLAVVGVMMLGGSGSESKGGARR